MTENLYEKAYKKLCEDEILKKALENEDIAIIDVKNAVLDSIENFKDTSEDAVLSRLTDISDAFATEVLYNKYYEIINDEE
ncbi:MAG TPA: hypothetical protein PKU94_06490 [Candidatus Hydrothermia bacterium]|nr:hypothetical protein [Candidatus Hydrothermia bacterium]